MATYSKQLKKQVSYATEEVERLTSKEKELMSHYRWNYSQLHKNLVEDRHAMVSAA